MNLNGSNTHLDSFRVHLIILFWLSPVKSGISLLVDQKIRIIDFLELEFDGPYEPRRHKLRSFLTWRTYSQHRLASRKVKYQAP